MSKVQEKTGNGHIDRQSLLDLLKEKQDEEGYLSKNVLCEVAKSLGLDVSEVYGVATFYSFFGAKPCGRNIIRICRSLPCHLKNYQLIVESIRKELGINPGETTPDKRFTLEFTNCIGACDNAPAMMVNDDVHINLTPEKVAQVLRAYK